MENVMKTALTLILSTLSAIAIGQGAETSEIHLVAQYPTDCVAPEHNPLQMDIKITTTKNYGLAPSGRVHSNMVVTYEGYLSTYDYSYDWRVHGVEHAAFNGATSSFNFSSNNRQKIKARPLDDNPYPALKAFYYHVNVSSAAHNDLNVMKQEGFLDKFVCITD